MFLMVSRTERSSLARVHYIILYDGNLHRLFLSQVRNVLDARIALCAERVDVHPVLAPDDEFLQLAAHLPVLHVGQQALEDAEVHPRADALHQFNDLAASLVVADVVCYDVKMPVQ